MANVEFMFERILEGTVVPIMAVLKPVATAMLAKDFIVRRVFNIPKLNGCFIRKVASESCPLVLKAAIFCDTVLMFFVVLISVTCILVSPEVGLVGKEKWRVRPIQSRLFIFEGRGGSRSLLDGPDISF